MYEIVLDMDYQDAVSSVPETTNLASDYLTMLSAPNQNANENVNPSSEYLPMAPGKKAPDQRGAENTKK